MRLVICCPPVGLPVLAVCAGRLGWLQACCSVTEVLLRCSFVGAAGAQKNASGRHCMRRAGWLAGVLGCPGCSCLQRTRRALPGGPRRCTATSAANRQPQPRPCASAAAGRTGRRQRLAGEAGASSGAQQPLALVTNTTAVSARGAAFNSAVVLVDKPVGYTSHDVCSRLRGVLRIKKVLLG